MLSRKEYIGLCDALAEGMVNGKPLDSLCVYFKNDNPRFDAEKFKTFLGTLVEKKKEARDVPF